MVAMLNGGHPEAVERFSDAVAHQPDYLEARVGLADALRGDGAPGGVARALSAGWWRPIPGSPTRGSGAWRPSPPWGAAPRRASRLGEAEAILPGHPQLARLRAQLP